MSNPADGSLFVTVRQVADLEETDFCSATITATSRAIDEVLERIGKGGNIELIGTALSRKDALAYVVWQENQAKTGKMFHKRIAVVPLATFPAPNMLLRLAADIDDWLQSTLCLTPRARRAMQE